MIRVEVYLCQPANIVLGGLVLARVGGCIHPGHFDRIEKSGEEGGDVVMVVRDDVNRARRRNTGSPERAISCGSAV